MRNEVLADELLELRGMAGRFRASTIYFERGDELAADAAKQWTAGFNPRPVGPPELQELYEAAHG